MEERIIDDEYGRGIRLKKTKDGFVDVTDELAAEQGEEEQADEVSFEFPMMEGEEAHLEMKAQPAKSNENKKKHSNHHAYRSCFICFMFR